MKRCMSNGILLTSWFAALLLLSFDILRILFLYRVGVRDFSLRHDVCVLFKGTFAGCEDAKSETDECRPSTPAHADAAGCCGRVQGLTNFGQALFRSSKSRSHPWPPQLSSSLQTHSRACFIVGVRDAILPISFSSAT
jgi:hypothetical protein